MAMKALHNLSAHFASDELNKNATQASKALSKLAGGQKINSAGDNPSNLAISEKMREQLRSLLQDNQNVQNGAAIIKTAEAGIGEIVRQLQRLKELAINAANDSNTDEDRRVLQKEFDSRRAEIDDIALASHYNGKGLIDGSLELKPTTVWVNPEGDTPVEEPDDEDELPPDYDSIFKNVIEPTSNSVVQITADDSGDKTIHEDGVYFIDEYFSGTITLADTAKNVKLTAAPSSYLNDVNIVGASSGGMNLWIENLNIENSDQVSIIKFQGSDNVLTFRGENLLISDSNENAVINSAGGLTVQGDASSLLVINLSGGEGAGIGSDCEETLSGDIGIVNANLEINVNDGAGIGSGSYNASVGNITVENSNMLFTGGMNACVGAGYDHSSAGNILVVASRLVDTESIDAGIGSGYTYSSCGTITVLNSYVDVYNNDSPAIGAGDEFGTCGDIFISNSEIKCSSEHGAAVGSGRNATASNVTITNATKVTHIARGYDRQPVGDGAAVGSGENGHVGSIKISQSSLALLDASQAYLDPDQTPPYSGIGVGRGGSAGDIGDMEEIEDDPGFDGGGNLIEHTIFVGNPLWIHHGVNAWQGTNFFIKSMRATNLSLDDAEVTTRQKALDAIDAVDTAMKYALGELTNMGAYRRRLEFTGLNVTTASENVTNSESTIRDADMAREFVTYTKHNLLTQSSQAMLAQANQSQSSIKELLQPNSSAK